MRPIHTLFSGHHNPARLHSFCGNAKYLTIIDSHCETNNNHQSYLLDEARIAHVIFLCVYLKLEKFVVNLYHDYLEFKRPRCVKSPQPIWRKTFSEKEEDTLQGPHKKTIDSAISPPHPSNYLSRRMPIVLETFNCCGEKLSICNISSKASKSWSSWIACFGPFFSYFGLSRRVCIQNFPL